MNDEELEQQIKTLSESLNKLANSEEPLTKQQKNQRYISSLKKETLLRIREARQKGDKSQEYRNITMYSIITTYGEKHPFLMRLMISKLGAHF